MNVITLLVAIGLVVLFIISLFAHVAATWFTWLVLLAAVLLFISATRTTTARRATKSV
jgi:hypothetical protein